MSTHFEQYQQRIRDKYNMPEGKLETDSNRPLHIRDDHSPSKFGQERLAYLKERYGLDCLQVEGHYKAEQKGQNIQTLIDQREREAMRGMKLAYGTTEYRGEPLRIWFTIRI